MKKMSIEYFSFIKRSFIHPCLHNSIRVAIGLFGYDYTQTRKSFHAKPI